jgi:hypothetical protein
MSFPNPDNYARDCDCGTAGANTTPPPASLITEAATAIRSISSSSALDFGNITAGNFSDLTITLSGAATNDVVFVTCLNTAGRGATDGKLIFEAFVSATDTVTVRAHNPTSGAIDSASYNFKVCIIKS